MTKKTRTILFLICLFLFLLIAPVTIFYSQGFRFDFEAKKITQTGGLFLKVFPKSAEIYLDGKLKKKTDFFFGSVLIENLLPKKYKIEVKKEGYLTWEKILEIKEQQVTEAKNIILFPESPTFNILTTGVKDFWFSPDEKKIILKEADEKLWSLKLYDLEKNVKSHLISEDDVYSAGADLLNLEFAENSKEISLEIGMKEQAKNFVLNLEKFPPLLTEKEISPIPQNIITSQNFNAENYYLDNSGHLFKNGEKLTRESFPVKPETEYVLKIFSNFVFLQEGQTLYQLNPESKSFEKFFEQIKNLKISPDLKKIVYFSDYEIWISFLKDADPPTTHLAGDRVFLVRLSEKIGDCFWLNSNYLVFNAGNKPPHQNFGGGGKIKIAEIDDRDRINIIDLAEFENPEIFFNKSDKKLYLLSNENLYVSGTLF